MPCLCPLPTSQPCRCRCRDAKWNMRAGFFSFQSCPLRRRTPGPQTGREGGREGDKGWSSDSHSLWMSTSFPPLSRFSPPFSNSSPASPLPLPPSFLPSPLVPLSSSQLSRLRNGRRDRGLLPGEMGKGGLRPPDTHTLMHVHTNTHTHTHTHTCCIYICTSQHLPTCAHVVQHLRILTLHTMAQVFTFTGRRGHSLNKQLQLEWSTFVSFYSQSVLLISVFGVCPFLSLPSVAPTFTRIW